MLSPAGHSPGLSDLLLDHESLLYNFPFKTNPPWSYVDKHRCSLGEKRGLPSIPDWPLLQEPGARGVTGATYKCSCFHLRPRCLLENRQWLGKAQDLNPGAPHVQEKKK